MRRWLAALAVAVAAAAAAGAGVARADRLGEKLVLTPLADGKTIAHAQFDLLAGATLPGPVQHYDMFPRVLAEVVDRLHVREMRVALTQGRWDADRWGYAEVTAPTGAQLYAWLDSDASLPTSVDERWQELVHAVSGILCASFNFLTLQQTSAPTTVFPLSPVIPESNYSSFILRYGHLPAETMCTENLTPWLKLLPCGSASGFATLLQSKSIFNSHYQSLSLHYVAFPLISRLSMSLTSVLRPGKPGPTPGFIRRIFNGRFLRGGCPLSERSLLIVNTMNVPNATVEVLDKSSSLVTFERHGDHMWLAPCPPQDSAPELIDFEVNVPRNDGNTRAPVQMFRFLSGYGQQSGRLVTQIDNHLNSSILVNVAEHYPWFLCVFLHTLEIHTEHRVPVSAKDMRYLPPVPRHHPGLLELQLDLPPLATTFISIQFEYVFLLYHEHRPDANRGFDIGGSVLRLSCQPGDEARVPCGSVLYANNVLASLPTPDFSMPYNVITFTSTLLALFFGSAFKLLTSEFSSVSDDGGALGRLKQLLQSFSGRFVRTDKQKTD